jgi:hypothetical protein
VETRTANGVHGKHVRPREVRDNVGEIDICGGDVRLREIRGDVRSIDERIRSVLYPCEVVVP